jgi:hypothetical protein
MAAILFFQMEPVAQNEGTEIANLKKSVEAGGSGSIQIFPYKQVNTKFFAVR